MSENNMDDSMFYNLTQNVITKNKFMNIDKRKWLDMIISLAILVAILFIINFTSIVRLMAFLVYGTTLVILNLRGIRNRSVSEIIAAEVEFKKNKTEFHLRGPEWKRKEGVYKYADYKERDLRKLVNDIKSRIDRFVKENS